MPKVYGTITRLKNRKNKLVLKVPFTADINHAIF